MAARLENINVEEHYSQETPGEVAFLRVRGNLVDEEKAPGKSDYFQRDISKEVFNSWSSDPEQRAEDFKAHLRSLIDEAHFVWMKRIEAEPPPPAVFQTHEVAALLGDTKIEVEQPSFDRGVVPDSIRRQEERSREVAVRRPTLGLKTTGEGEGESDERAPKA